MSRQEELFQLLKDLGDTPYDVRERLNAEGIKGQAGSALVCPIARYLTRKTRMVCSTGLTYSSLQDFRSEEYYVVEHTQAIRSFVEMFDQDLFPELKE